MLKISTSNDTGSWVLVAGYWVLGAGSWSWWLVTVCTKINSTDP